MGLQVPSIIEEVDAYEVVVQECFVPDSFNEEIPIYVLDLGGTAMVIGGQWLYDPHTLLAADYLFDAWQPGENFFSAFTVRVLTKRLEVLRLKVRGRDLISAKRLPSDLHFLRLHECEIIPLGQESLLGGLASAGVIK